MPERKGLSRQKELAALQIRVGERVKQELPPQEATELEIRAVHRRMRRLARNARKRGSNPFDPLAVQSDIEATIDPAHRSTAEFWSHFVHGPMHVIPMQFMLTREVPGHVFPESGIRSSQKRVYDLLNIWKGHPGNQNTDLMRAGYDAFSEAAFAFDWARSETLIRGLSRETGKLAHLYYLIEGRLPLSRITQIIYEEQTHPSKL